MFTYRGTVADLKRLEDVEEELGGLLTQEHARAGGRGMVDLPRSVNSAERSGHVGHDTGHTDPVGLPGDVLEAEGLLDSFLHALGQ